MAVPSKDNQTVLVDEGRVAVSSRGTDSGLDTLLLVRLDELEVLDRLCFPLVHLLVVDIKGV